MNYYAKLISVFSFTTLFFFFANGLEPRNVVEPRVINNNAYSQSVVLGKDVDKALKEKDRTFKMLVKGQFDTVLLEDYGYKEGQLPQAIAADFNNDRIKDAVVMGTANGGKDVVIYGVLSSKSGYKVSEMWRWTKSELEPYYAETGGEFKNWPRMLELTGDPQEEFLNLNILRPHPKFLSLGVEEKVFYMKNGVLKPISSPLRIGPRSGARRQPLRPFKQPIRPGQSSN